MVLLKSGLAGAAKEADTAMIVDEQRGCRKVFTFEALDEIMLDRGTRLSFLVEA